MHDGGLLEPQPVHVGGQHPALFVIAGAGAEEQRQPFFRQADGGGAGGDLQHVLLGVDVLGGFGDGRAVGADDGHRAAGHQALGGQGRRAGVAGIVTHQDFHLAAPGRGVELFRQTLDYGLHVLALGSPLAGEGAHDANLDGGFGGGESRAGRQTQQQASQ